VRSTLFLSPSLSVVVSCYVYSRTVKPIISKFCILGFSNETVYWVNFELPTFPPSGGSPFIFLFTTKIFCCHGCFILFVFAVSPFKSQGGLDFTVVNFTTTKARALHRPSQALVEVTSILLLFMNTDSLAVSQRKLYFWLSYDQNYRN